jgi:transcriptional antiterminator RfaH
MAFWSVAQTESLREKTAQRFLEQAGFENYLPMIRTENRIAPLFPGYLFVRIIDRWAAISSTIGIISLLSSGELPAKVPDPVIAEIKRKERSGVVTLPRPRGLQPGDRVRIVAGSFMDRLGLHAGMSTQQRQFVLLELLGRRVRVELPNRYVQRVG